MNTVLIFALAVFALQLVLFFFVKSKRKDLPHRVMRKYGIESPRDAWNLINDPDIPESDRIKIEKFYLASRDLQ